MKIAVLIAGEYREFAIAHKFWSFLKWPDVDTYFATWDTSITVNYDVVNFPPVDEPVLVEDITKFLNPQGIDIAKSPPDKLQNASAKMLSRWRAGIELLRNSGKQYDRVILIRPDIALDYDEEELKTFISEKPVSDDDIYGIIGGRLDIPFPLETVNQVSDLMLIGNQNSILKLTEIENIPDKDFDIHSYLAGYFMKFYKRFMNIPIPRQCIVRSNCRGLMNPSFQECKFKAKEWWEKKYARFYHMGENVYLDSQMVSHTIKQKNSNSINLWNKQDLHIWPECLTTVEWVSPDSKENYQTRKKDNPDLVTYQLHEVSYRYNSRGFRMADRGPSEYEDAVDCNTLLVGGCSLTEGIGMPEKHLWHNFLLEKIYPHSKKPIAKFNIGKGGRSIDAVIRYVYAAIQHEGLIPSMVYLALPPISRQEIILMDHLNSPYIFDIVPSTTPIETHTSEITAHEFATKHLTYRQQYHNCFRNLLLLKWFLAAKQIPFFFSFWGNDFWFKEITKRVEGNQNTDFSIPPELQEHYIRACLSAETLLKSHPFEQTIARDYMHPGPNIHYELAETMYNGLSRNSQFNELVTKWKNNG